ncbi:copper resistance CopC family protein [Massilia alkalitolerans]|uniref:copper resistance CopC family protein n=1 Tax=Massilia alkalitolerans TaxID=286638 RepID=UPI00146FBAC1
MEKSPAPPAGQAVLSAPHSVRRPLLARLPKQWFLFLLSCTVLLPAWGHTRLLGSVPEQGALVHSPPAAVVLVFSAPPEARFNRIELRRGGRWQALVTQQDGARLRAALPALDPGPYRVRWRVLSRDGHSQDGKLDFTVR